MKGAPRPFPPVVDGDDLCVGKVRVRPFELLVVGVQDKLHAAVEVAFLEALRRELEEPRAKRFRARPPRRVPRRAREPSGGDRGPGVSDRREGRPAGTTDLNALFELPEEAVVVRAVCIVAELSLEPQQLGPLLARETGRHARWTIDDEMAAAAALERGQPAARNPVQRPGLDAGSELDLERPLRRVLGTAIPVPSAAPVIVTEARTTRSSPSRSTPSSGRTRTLT